MNPSSHMPGDAHPVAIPRPQMSIERLPARRQANEPRESMNCKSCRKRKIKCNRMRPACAACQIFQCPCVYDAVPKKRGPKTDVLEALLKRVDGLEAKLKKKNAEGSSAKAGESAEDEAAEEAEADKPETIEPPPKRVATESNKSPVTDVARLYPSGPAMPREVPASPVWTDAFLHTYFTRFHGKPYYILDESSVRQRMQLNQLPYYLCYAICAVAGRHTPHPHGHHAAIKASEDYAAAARREIDTDEPSMDGLQALLLLVLAFTAAGKGKKAYMMMTSAIGMAMALELHRERDAQAQVTPAEREQQRRVFWTCYLLDRFLTCGTKRASLIRDKSIVLRRPSWCPAPSTLPVDGEFFQHSSNLQYIHGTGKKSQGCLGMLIDITRILGITNRYLAAGGVKGDSHFPWHSLSTLSKIRQELDFWASGTGDMFSGLHALFRQQDATILVLSKLIYHLIHCLVYRPFLPIDLAELAGNGQHQSWQIEATNMCFLHANAMAELIDFARQASSIEWPALVGYCICAAATVHIHGAHYSNPSASGEMNVFSSSREFLSREMQQLGELQYAWANVQHQRETLQVIYTAHGELVNALVGNAMRYTPGFHLEDFFDRYSNIGGPGGKSYRFDAAHLSLSDTVADFVVPSYAGSELTGTQGGGDLKRKNTASLSQKRSDMTAPPVMESQAPGLPSPAQSRTMSYQTGVLQRSPAGPAPIQQYAEKPLPQQYTSSPRNPMDHIIPKSAVSAPGQTYGISPTTPATAGQGMPALTGTGYSPYGYSSGLTPSNTGHASMNDNTRYDPMFGTMPTSAFTSPTAWQGDDSQQHKMHLLNSGAAPPSPGTKSTGGSTGTAPTDEKDPFLSLLEELAEEDQQRFNDGTDLEFFLTSNGFTGNGGNT
ncbi:putative transcriptional regulatory protein [Tolypocladium ophioglossoides CBS 100239]|uniref:Putative transcriptional regulatory protein n=1 Tax=Tolypocladium ophioglossoides (strain CBS 100239) TaxID=1163406 RepID=A0A0L0N4L5_TOLOC|nr:putative transcriptional regulatory protein [Tolypocladium ophioglossoides CBS 100239]